MGNNGKLKINKFYYEYQYKDNDWKEKRRNDEYFKRNEINFEGKNENDYEEFRKELFTKFIDSYLMNFPFSMNSIIIDKYELIPILFNIIQTKDDFYNFLIGNLEHFKEKLNNDNDYNQLKEEKKKLLKIKNKFYNVFEDIYSNTLELIKEREKVDLKEAISIFNYDDEDNVVGFIYYTLESNYLNIELSNIYHITSLALSSIYNNFKSLEENNLKSLAYILYQISDNFELSERYFGNKILNGGKFEIRKNSEEYYSDLDTYYYELLSYDIDKQIEILFDIIKSSTYIYNNEKEYDKLNYLDLKSKLEKKDNEYYSMFFSKILYKENGDKNLLLETFSNEDLNEEIHYFKMELK